jgi:hypothetical protein
MTVGVIAHGAAILAGVYIIAAIVLGIYGRITGRTDL